jgi:hypothetical protein
VRTISRTREVYPTTLTDLVRHDDRLPDTLDGTRDLNSVDAHGGPRLGPLRDPDDWDHAIRKLGYTAASFQLSTFFDGVTIDDTLINAYAAAARQADITIAEVATFFQAFPNEQDRKESIAQWRACLEIAARPTPALPSWRASSTGTGDRAGRREPAPPAAVLKRLLQPGETGTRLAICCWHPIGAVNAGCRGLRSVPPA